MGLFAEASWKRATSGISNPASWVFDAIGGTKTSSGERVNEDSALSISAVWAAVRLISETLAALPLHTYKRLQPRGKERATTHPLAPLLHGLVNERQTSFEWRELSQAHLCLRGNAFSLIERDRNANVVELLPLRPDYMKAFRGPRDNEVIFSWEPPGLPPIRRVAGSGDILHVRGFSTGDGILGLSPIAFARESLGIAKASETFAGRWFGEGATPSGILTHPQVLDEGPMKRLKQSVKEFRGASKSHKTMILEEGMKWEQVGIAPDDSQLLETRKFSVTDIARWFRVPPHLIADLERATFSNVEEQSLEFVTYSMTPWFSRWEQAISRDVLVGPERQQFFVEFLVAGLLRGDIKSRYEAYAVGRMNGWLSPNDVREFENMNPLPEGQGGGEYLSPLNMAPAGSERIPASATPPTDPTEPVEPEIVPPRQADDFDLDAALTPSEVLNGAQVTSLVDVVAKVKANEIPEASGIEIIQIAFGIDPDVARKIILGRAAVTPALELRARQTRSLDTRRRTGQAFEAIFEDAGRKVVRAEIRELRKVAEKLAAGNAEDFARFAERVESLYVDGGDWAALALRTMEPAYRGLAKLIEGQAFDDVPVDVALPDLGPFVVEMAAAFVASHAAKSRRQMSKLAEEHRDDLARLGGAVTSRLDEWQTERPKQVAMRETVRTRSATARRTYRAAGVTRLMWRASGENCPFCTRLDGKIVGIDEVFATKDDLFPAEGRSPLKLRTNIAHPPIHRGCDCDIVNA